MDANLSAYEVPCHVVIDTGVGCCDECESLHPARWGARVEIVTATGKCYSARTDFPRGDPENPLDDEKLISKFCRLAGHSWSKEKVETLLEAALNLEDVEDVASLFN